MTNLSQNIIYEDDDYVALNKPAGLIVHPDGRTREPSVSEWFRNKFPESLEVGERMVLVTGEVLERPGVVHRIDRETSGALLLAKTEAGHRALKEQFQNRQVTKIYHLFVYGSLKRDQGTINLPIGRSVRDFRKWSAGRGARGEKREAITPWRVIGRAPDKTFTFIEARPKTGRTHQIRVHFRALGHPIVSDKLYGPKKQPPLGFERLALHARAITFKNMSGREITVEAAYPEDFKRAIDVLN